MALPLVPIVIGIAVVSASGLIAAQVLRSRLAGKRVAILGRIQVGKSALRDQLRKDDPGDAGDGPGSRGRFSLKVGKDTVDFVLPQDISGFQGLGFEKWEHAFIKSDHVWYLFRADRIAQGDREEIEHVRHDLDMFKSWLDDRRHRPKIMLIGTWADQAPEYASDQKAFIRRVSAATPLSVGSVKLGHAPVVIGSLATRSDARRLIKAIGSHLE